MHQGPALPRLHSSPQAIEAIVDHSDGFPFFVQTWADHTWNAAYDEPISRAHVDLAAPHANHALESSFFAARIARIPASEAAYVQALASLGAGPHRVVAKLTPRGSRSRCYGVIDEDELPT